MSEQPKKLCELLRRWRDRNGWKQWKAAEVLGAKLPTYRNWERGRNTPQGRTLEDVLSTIQPLSAPKK